jgi:catechol 2,3-dioxygenase-like lactoylglutathione lyase family enzyme
MSVEFRLTPHIAVQVKNCDKAVGFYRDVLGFEEKGILHGEHHMMKGHTNFYIEPNDGQLTFFEFATNNFEEAKQLLLSHDCEITDTFSPTSAMFKDAFGLRFHVYEERDA